MGDVILLVGILALAVSSLIVFLMEGREGDSIIRGTPIDE